MEESTKQTKSKRKPQAKAIEVKTFKRAGGSQLVEWVEDGLPHRVILPIKETYTKSDLDKGITYGCRWDQLELNADAKQLAEALYKNDIWTLEDVSANPRAVIGICMNIMGANLSSIMKFAKPKKEAK